MKRFVLVAVLALATFAGTLVVARAADPWPDAERRIENLEHQTKMLRMAVGTLQTEVATLRSELRLR